MDVNVHLLTSKIRNVAREASNEEELRYGVSKVLEEVVSGLGVKGRFEKATAFLDSGRKRKGRIDALYGGVIIEYKAPGKLRDKNTLENAIGQVKRYITSEAGSEELYPYYLGVVFDGYTIVFVRYWRGSFRTIGPLPFNEESLEYLLDAIRGLTRKPLEAETLLKDFGPKSETAHKALKAFYNSLENPKSERTELLFEDWRRIFSQVCSYTPEKLKKLAKFYGFENADPEKLTFALHTYYTLLMKLIVSEIVSVLSVGLASSILTRLHESYLNNPEGLRFVLEEELEEGGLFRQLGIRNFLEADYFAWYLEEWNEEIAEVIHEMVRKLMDYEPSTVEQTPERVEDLFKRLYQNLVPREIRHSLGEYFTPDWLAELTLEEAGYDGNPDVRVLDPACGSGTFLVLAIKMAREWALEHWGVSSDAQTELLEKITKNIVGIDLNPLAVLASKANYLIALGKLIRYRTGDVTIPVYLADSITVSTKTSARGGKRIALKTVAGEFEVPLEIIEKGLVDKVFEAIEDGLRRNYSPGKFVAYLYTYKLKGRKFSQDTEDALKELYKKLHQLEQEGKDRIWTRVLRNAFAPLTIGKFDLVVGNPPWVAWENLPEEYRKLTRGLWDYYGLIYTHGKSSFKKDLSMLFVARTFDRYLKPGGRLAFLVPFTLFKTQAGAGFRRFLTYGRRREPRIPVRLIRVHDLVTLYPFEGATTRTGLLVVEKAEKTEFPVPLVVWNWPDSKGADVEATLEDVKKKAKIHQLVFIPIEDGKPESPWMMTTEKAYKGIKKALGSSEYEAYEGVLTALNGVYWVQILNEVPPDKVLIENLWDIGKKKVRKVRAVVEKSLVYPLLRGRDVKKWFSSHEYWIIVPHSSDGKAIPESTLKIHYPQTYEYFTQFKEQLLKRAIKPFLGKNSKKEPFYQIDNIGARTFAPYKVVWKYISGKISGKAEFKTAVVEPHNGLIQIPDHKLMFVPLEDENEAHYLSAVLNSTITQLIVASYTIETQISTHVLNNVKVPTFDPSNPTHLELANLSKRAHEVAREKYKLLGELKALKASLKGKRGNERKELKAKIEELNEKISETEEKLGKIEAEIDEKVAELYGITEEELEEIERLYRVLME